LQIDVQSSPSNFYNNILNNSNNMATKVSSKHRGTSPISFKAINSNSASKFKHKAKKLNLNDVKDNRLIKDHLNNMSKDTISSRGSYQMQTNIKKDKLVYNEFN